MTSPVHIDVYLATCTAWEHVLRNGPSPLSEVEQERAARYIIQRARDEFVLGRVVARQVLGQRIGCAPHQVPFHLEASGKPSVEGCEFSLSHSRGLVALAVSTGPPVGVDVEWQDPAVEVDEIARQVFTHQETLMLQTCVDDATKQVAFFNIWTAFEARQKVDGQGIAAVGYHEEDAAKASSAMWWTTLPDLPVGYAGAVACGTEAVVRVQAYLPVVFAEGNHKAGYRSCS